jgi:drug/metabolite transporter (DMT)-like permease
MTPRVLPPERAAWMALLILTLIWSLNWTVMKTAMAYSGPFTFSALRYVIGTVVLFALLLLRRDSLRPPPVGPTILIGLAQTTGFQALAQWALVAGGAGKTALFAYTMPFWVVPLAWWWLREKPGPGQWLAIGLAAAGFACVVEPWRPLGSPRSIVLAVIAGLCWAVGTVIAKRVFRRGDVKPLSLTAWQMLVGTLGLIGLSLLTPERPIAWTTPFVLALLYNGLLSSGVCWALWLLIVHRLPTHVAGLTSLAVPVAGVLFAWGLLGERPSGPEATGIVLVGAALLALNFARRVPA